MTLISLMKKVRASDVINDVTIMADAWLLLEISTCRKTQKEPHCITPMVVKIGWRM